MATKTKNNNATDEPDGTYLLKIVMYVIFASFWIKFASPVTIGAVTLNGLPIGLFVGLIFASHDHFQTDRKIEYPLIILVTLVSYFYASGIVI